MAMDNRVKLEIASLKENVGLARLLVAAVAAQLQFTVTETEEAKVAVSEAVTNAVVHAYEGGEGTVQVEIVAQNGELKVVVSDFGRGIDDLRQARQPAFSTDPERMGLGFMFMENFMDHVEIDTGPGQGTRVRMRKRAGNLGPVPTSC